MNVDEILGKTNDKLIYFWWYYRCVQPIESPISPMPILRVPKYIYILGFSNLANYPK